MLKSQDPAVTTPLPLSRPERTALPRRRTSGTGALCPRPQRLVSEPFRSKDGAAPPKSHGRPQGTGLPCDNRIRAAHTLQGRQENNCPQTKRGAPPDRRYTHCLSNGWKVYKKTANFVLWLWNWSSALLEPGFFGNSAVVTTIFFTYCYRKGTLFNLIEDTIKSKYTGAFNKNSMRRTFKAK